MRAHRTNIGRQNASGDAATPLPRQVHVYLLRYTDKQYILRNAASALQDNPFQEANVYLYLRRCVEKGEGLAKETQGEAY